MSKILHLNQRQQFSISRNIMSTGIATGVPQGTDLGPIWNAIFQKYFKLIIELLDF